MREETGEVRLRKLMVALIALGLSVAGAAFSSLRVSRLRTEASWLLATADAYAGDYGASLEGRFAEAELASFDQRRAVLERAHRWQRLEIACLLAAAAAAFTAYGLYLFRRASDDELGGGLLHAGGPRRTQSRTRHVT